MKDKEKNTGRIITLEDKKAGYGLKFLVKKNRVWIKVINISLIFVIDLIYKKSMKKNISIKETEIKFLLT
jgi:hypothetical protein